MIETCYSGCQMDLASLFAFIVSDAWELFVEARHSPQIDQAVIITSDPKAA